MKKFHVLLGSAFMLTLSATTMSSCSNDSLAAVEDDEFVEIKLGSRTTATVTRAVEVSAWSGQTIGIWGLNNGTDGFKAPTNATSNKTYALFNGQAVQGTVASTGAVTLADTYFYPRNSEATYSFYAYYPTTGTTTLTKDSVIVRNTTFAGNDDIMAGRSEYMDNAWNARYIRENSTTPDIVFNHLTTQFKVLFVQGQSPAGYDETLACNRISRAYIAVPSTYVITLAKAASYTTYQPTITWGTTINAQAAVVGTGAQYGSGEHAEANANAYFNGHIVPWQTYDPSRANSYKSNLSGVYNNLIFVPSGKTEYTLVIEYEDASKTEVPVKLSDGSAFVQGTSYNLTVRIYGPEKVQVTATITPWEQGEDIESEIQ